MPPTSRSGGQPWSRNLVSAEKNLPDTFDPKTGKNIKWSVALGSETHSTPVVARGRVRVGTDNNVPRHPRYQGGSNGGQVSTLDMSFSTSAIAFCISFSLPTRSAILRTATRTAA